MTVGNDDEGDNARSIRFAVFDPANRGSASIFTFEDQRDGTGRLTMNEDDPRKDAIVKSAHNAHDQCEASALPLENRFQHAFDLLLSGLQNDGFEVEVLPKSDVSMQFEIDLRSGTIVGQHEATHSFIEPREDISRNVASAINRALTEIAQSVEIRLTELLESSDHINAAIYVTDEEQSARLLHSPSPSALEALLRIDRSVLPDGLRIELLNTAVTVAGNQEAYDIAGPLAEELIACDQSLDDNTKTSLMNVVAVAARHRGEIEYAIAVWKDLIKFPERVDAEERGWIWRNLSMALGERDREEAERTARQSFDSFIEAGDKREAAKSLAQLSRLQEEKSPESALGQIDNMLDLMNNNGLMNEEIRASILHAKGRRCLEMGDGQTALEASREAVAIRRGLLGVEEQLISSLHLAKIAFEAVGDKESAGSYDAEAKKLEESIKSTHFSFGRRVSKLLAVFDPQEARDVWREATDQEDSDIVAGVGVAVLVNDPDLNPLQRLGKLESLLILLEMRRSRKESKQPVYLAIAQTLRDMGEVKRATVWSRRAYDENPLDVNNRNQLVQDLWSDNNWVGAALFLEQQIRRVGQLPGLLHAYGRSLFESGNMSGAVTALQKALKFEDNNVERQAAIRALRDQALDLGGTIQAEVPITSPQSSVYISDVERALAEFGAFISGVKRMTFWKKPTGATDYEWVNNPEAYGQTLLHTFMQAKFGQTCEVYEELDTGAGRLDVLVRFHGGLSVLVELKMCGFGYTSTYAASGEGQIRHYMDNRSVNIGFLLVFDARLRDYGKPLIQGDLGNYTIKESLIDVRPRPPSSQSR